MIHFINKTPPAITATFNSETAVMVTKEEQLAQMALQRISQLGHSDIKTTLNIYTHLDAKFKKRSMAKLNAYLSPNNETLQNGF